MDITVYYNGFHGDLNETFFVGHVDEEAKKLVQTTYECLMQAIDSGRISLHVFLVLLMFFAFALPSLHLCLIIHTQLRLFFPVLDQV